MKVYFFTYGTSSAYPFRGGWTKVSAPDRNTAIQLFRIFHPDRTEGIINCADVYDYETFKNKTMYLEGNFGARCHDHIKVMLRRYTE